MAFRQSPNLVASGAMGIVTGLAIVGGLVFALSLSAEADGAVTTPRETQSSAISESVSTVQTAPIATSETPLELRTYGNSTARMIALSAALKDPDAVGLREGGEVVALNDAKPATDQPQS